MGDNDAMTTTLSRRDGMKVLRQTLTVCSEARRDALDITADVRGTLEDAGIHSGLIIVNCLHTTCSVLVAEARPALLEDFVELMRRFLEDGTPDLQNDPRLSARERGTATKCLRAVLRGHSVAIGITDGGLLLNGSEAILLAEWAGPRARRVHVQIMGV
jgi:secondary thiamine-phosphate synthase enzyme